MNKLTLVSLASAFCLVSVPAHAALVITISEVGSDVQVVGSGTLNINDLSPFLTSGSSAFLQPRTGFLLIGASGNYTIYQIPLPPGSYGTGEKLTPTTSSGDKIGFGSSGSIFVPEGYVSGQAISSTATYNNTTMASLGLAPRTYTSSWGTGANADSMTMTVVPEPTTALLTVLSSLCLLRRKRR